MFYSNGDGWAQLSEIDFNITNGIVTMGIIRQTNTQWYGSSYSFQHIPLLGAYRIY